MNLLFKISITLFILVILMMPATFILKIWDIIDRILYNKLMDTYCVILMVLFFPTLVTFRLSSYYTKIDNK